MMTVVVTPVTPCRRYEPDCQQGEQSDRFHNFSFSTTFIEADSSKLGNSAVGAVLYN
jgi:hypothetical protein